MSFANKPVLNSTVSEAFGVNESIDLLPGGIDLKTYRSGDVILRNLGADSHEAGIWHAELFDRIQENGFRIAKPIRAKDGSWMVSGWVAEHFLEGRHSTKTDIPAAINAISHFHDALTGIPLPDYRKRNPTMWDRADQWAWTEVPDSIDPQLYKLAIELQKLKEQINVKDQLIHGDLNFNNILIADNLPPAIIDFTPYYRPAEFALAVTAYWSGPYTGDSEILEHFKHIKEFGQMLIRAGLRMMLTQEDPQHATELEKYKKANEIIKQFVR